MSIQDKLEHILKEIHVFFSKGDVYMNSPDKVIINKREMFDLLEKLNLCIYEMMDQYEVTVQSRELAQRRSEKKGEAIIDAATKSAEDVYAASFVYTDDALGHINNIVSEASISVQKIFDHMNDSLEKEKERIKTNQFELREQLQDFKDTDKYLRLIDELNKERENEQDIKEKKEDTKKIQNDAKHYSIPKPEIKINKDYFEQMGYDTEENEEETVKEEAVSEVHLEEEQSEEEQEAAQEAQIKVDLDAEYFKWKEESDTDEEEPKKPKKEKKFLFW